MNCIVLALQMGLVGLVGQVGQVGFLAGPACLSRPSGLASQVIGDRNQREALRHYRAGEEALHGERLDVAEREFHQAVKLDPLLHLAHYGLGQVFMLTKRYPSAVRAFLDAREAFRVGAAQALQDETAYQQQIDDQIRALEDTRRTFEGYNGGPPKVLDRNSYIQRIDTQINQLRNQRWRNPDRPTEVPGWISLALGSAYFRSDAMADAEREYREAIRVESKLGEAHNNLAVVLMLTGRLEDADREMKAAERAGFHVSPLFKEDLKKAMAGRSG